MNVALSPCPNDTFLFYAWIHGKVGDPIQPTFADIVDLNAWALEGRFPLIKLSFATFMQVRETYRLLPAGAALGFGCGPKVVAKPGTTWKRVKKLAVPGKLTTANLLVDRLLNPGPSKHYCRYHEVCELILSGQCDAGIVIHETRFTFGERGLIELCDLGELWEEKTHLPLPLGGIAIRRDVVHPERVLHALRASIHYAMQHSEEPLPFMLKHSIEKDESVVRSHIETFVNPESLALSREGVAALEYLLETPSEKWLFHETHSVCHTL